MEHFDFLQISFPAGPNILKLGSLHFPSCLSSLSLSKGQTALQSHNCLQAPQSSLLTFLSIATNKTLGQINPFSNTLGKLSHLRSRRRLLLGYPNVPAHAPLA